MAQRKKATRKKKTEKKVTRYTHNDEIQELRVIYRTQLIIASADHTREAKNLRSA